MLLENIICYCLTSKIIMHKEKNNIIIKNLEWHDIIKNIRSRYRFRYMPGKYCKL